MDYLWTAMLAVWCFGFGYFIARWQMACFIEKVIARLARIKNKIDETK